MMKCGCENDHFLRVLQKKALQDIDDRAWIGGLKQTSKRDRA